MNRFAPAPPGRSPHGARSIFLSRLHLASGVLAAFAACMILLSAPGLASAATAPGLGTAKSFGVLGGSAVTNTGNTVINGDLGINPGTSITGFGPGVVNGNTHNNDALSGQAQADALTAYNSAAGQPFDATRMTLGGATLVGGVYRSGSTMDLTGTLILDAQGNPNTVWIFQVGSALTTAVGSSVSLINGAQACNVFWQIGSDATLNSGSVFAGNLLAQNAISVGDSVTVAGRLLARNAAITLINDTVNVANCAAGPDDSDSDDDGSDDGSDGGSDDGSDGGTDDGTDEDSDSEGSDEGTDSSQKEGTSKLVLKDPKLRDRLRRHKTSHCIARSFKVAVRGRRIDKVIFSLDGKRFSTHTKAPFSTTVRSQGGRTHVLRARVSYTDGTRSVTRTTRFRACSGVTSRRPNNRDGLTG